MSNLNLTRLEVAAIKRTAKNGASIRKRMTAIDQKIEMLQKEYEALDNSLQVWEEPVKKITGGLTSVEYLKTLEKPENTQSAQ